MYNTKVFDSKLEFTKYLDLIMEQISEHSVARYKGIVLQNSNSNIYPLLKD